MNTEGKEKRMPQAADLSFWFTPRKILRPSECSDELHEAVLRSNIIYGGPLMILDADLIHNSRIREGLRRGDPFFHGLFESGLLRIAMRKDANGTVDIKQTAWALRAPGTAITEIGQQYYAEASDLSDIVSTGANVGCYYAVEDAKKRYRLGVTAVFDRLSHNKKGSHGGLRSDVAAAIHQYLISIPEEVPVSWSTFLPESDLIKHLAGLGFDAFLKKHPNLVHRIARGPYVTVIPDIQQSAAIYSAEDRAPVDLYRGRNRINVGKEAMLEIPRDDLSLADHVRGLNALSIEDIDRLVTSKEKQNLDSALARASTGEISLDTATEYLAEYLRSVDQKIAAPYSSPDKAMFQLQLSSGFSGSPEALSAFGETLMISVKAASNHYVPGSSDLISGFATQFKPIYQELVKPSLEAVGITFGTDTVPEPPSELEMSQENARARTRLLRRFRLEDHLNESLAQIRQPSNGSPIQLTKGLYNSAQPESFTNPFHGEPSL